MISLVIVFLGCLLPLLAYSDNVIVPGATWTDTSGNAIQAHGGGILKVGDTFYWFGEDKATNSGLFQAVSCYTSPDLLNWTRQVNALVPIDGTMISTSNIVERPKGKLDVTNSEYVMWFHSDSSDYGAAMVGVATSQTPCGPYTYQSSWRPFGAESRDMSLFQDDARTSYLLYASDVNQNFKMAQLDTNYYNVTAVVSELFGATLEAPGIIKRNSVYYLFASHTSGWAPNPNKWFSAQSMVGPWSSQSDIAPPAVNTYFSQNAYDLPLGSGGIYMGDRWRPDLLGSSTYMWFPLDWSSGSPKIVEADVWNVDIDAGTYSVAQGVGYEAEQGLLSGAAVLFSNPAWSGGGAVGWLGNGGSVTINNVQGNGLGQWITISYANCDSSWRSTTVSVNSGPTVPVDQPNTGGCLVTLTVPVKLDLVAGPNSITVGSNQTTYAGDLDKIMVYG
ncbi:galactan 1,3-beta-galactosidase [Rickenella mellea]|uniref:Galactan 1,3-beta-galactosidase n=1 Tax=Rickenella mellea TaxID=50990 RepID=A0A4Y7QPM0_9AGAM|nr:galactan 1,3-beta-galactosidase [Rickenella mellea]